MDATTYDPSWETTSAGELTSEQLLAVALHRARTATDPLERAEALTAHSLALHQPTIGHVRRTREAITAAINEALTAGHTEADVAAAVGWTVKRVREAAADNAPKQAERQRVTARRRAVRTSAAQLKAEAAAAHAAALAVRGARYLDLLESGDPTINTAVLARQAGVSRQELTSWVNAARKARTTP